MDILNRISRTIEALPAGGQWTVTAQELWMSRSDFQSISAFLTLEARKGHFSLAAADESSMRLGSTALLVTKH